MSAFDPIAFLTSFCSIPTAPFREHLVMHQVDVFARKHRAIQSSRDAHGNTLLLRPGTRGAKLPRLIFVAHLDHPGFVASEMIDERTLRAEFRGGVLASIMRRAKARFFTDHGEIAATVLDTVADENGRCVEATLRVSDRVEPNTIGMFDVGTGVVKGKRFHCRCCDDLAGAAAALVMLDELAKKPAACDVGVLLTRGEEQGFIGAIASVVDPKLLRKTDRLVSIETSAEQPVARQGEGVVLRVGDKTSIFHSAFTRFIVNAAETLAATDETFKFQRALMPGGTCEATVFDAWGYVAGAICVALGNYHNMDKPRERIAAEYVHLDDWRNMVRLFVALAQHAHTFDGTHRELQDRLTARFESKRHLLRLRGTMHAGA